MKTSLTSLFFLFFIYTAYANASSVDISASSMHILVKDRKAVLYGSLFVTKGSVKLTSERLEITFTDERPKDLFFLGAASLKDRELILCADRMHFSINFSKIFLAGNVVFQKGKKLAYTNEAVYDLKSKEFVITGKKRKNIRVELD
tara:strand:- start:1216 stop:1653 length:438 start_codon:yes stop_codon:yes gene_type:complete